MTRGGDSDASIHGTPFPGGDKSRSTVPQSFIQVLNSTPFVQPITHSISSDFTYLSLIILRF
jgi:hypothetical protein